MYSIWFTQFFLDHGDSYSGFASLSGTNFPPAEERAGPEGAEEEAPSSSSSYPAAMSTHSGGVAGARHVREEDGEDAEDEDEGEEQGKGLTFTL